MINVGNFFLKFIMQFFIVLIFGCVALEILHLRITPHAKFSLELENSIANGR